MHKYEICIFRPDGRIALVTAATLWSDETAISCAKKISRGRKFEVWRGMDRVYGTPPPSDRGPLTPPPAA